MKGSSVNDLIGKLTHLKEAVEQRNRDKAKLTNMKPDLFRPDRRTNVLTFLTFVVPFILGSLLARIFPQPISFIVTVVIAIGSIYLAAKLRVSAIKKINRTLIQENKDKYGHEIEKHKDDYNKWENTILRYRKKGFIPDAHLSSFALHHMIMYLSNGSAHTLQEAINMYENNHVNQANSRILAGKYSDTNQAV